MGKPQTQMDIATLPKIRSSVKLESFCSHHTFDCAFCGQPAALGHLQGQNEPLCLHQSPCETFADCDTVEQFDLLSGLKIKSDQGILERN